MACYRPWQYEKRRGLRITLPCGRCIGCRQVKQRDWATRIEHEAQMHADNCFLTLTYRDEEYKPGLEHTDFQKFIRALRKAKNRENTEREKDTRKKQRQDKTRQQRVQHGHARKSTPIGPGLLAGLRPSSRPGPPEGGLNRPNKKQIRYFMSGEYGSDFKRPHFHAILFGITFKDLYPVAGNRSASHEIDKYWPHGFNTVGEVNHATAMYVAKYTTKVITGQAAQRHYERVNLATGEIIRVPPEYARMSLKPGIGARWHDRYWREVHLARDGVTQPGGRQQPAPRYYNELLKKKLPELWKKNADKRLARAAAFRKDSTPARLAVREHCALARQQQKQVKL